MHSLPQLFFEKRHPVALPPLHQSAQPNITPLWAQWQASPAFSIEELQTTLNQHHKSAQPAPNPASIVTCLPHHTGEWGNQPNLCISRAAPGQAHQLYQESSAQPDTPHSTAEHLAHPTTKKREKLLPQNSMLEIVRLNYWPHHFDLVLPALPLWPNAPRCMSLSLWPTMSSQCPWANSPLPNTAQ